jgi:uncharacterized protein (PEP-CTERM system associated)
VAVSQANQPKGGAPHSAVIILGSALAVLAPLGAAAQGVPYGAGPVLPVPNNPLPGQPLAPPQPGAPAEPGALAPGGELAAPAAGPTAAGQQPPWLITPSLAVSGQFTDNALGTPSQKKGDFITEVQPSLFITGQSSRLNGVFDYSPEALEHAAETSQNQIIQNLLVNGTVTAVPERLFFDGHAAMDETSRFGGRGFGNTTQIPTSDATRTTAYSGSPYVQFHFGTKGDAELRYTLSQTLFSGNTAAIPSATPDQAVGAISNSTQNEASAKFTSGEVLSRLLFTFNADYQRFNSTGSLDSRHALASAGGIYEVNPLFDLTSDLGYERLSYPNQAIAAFAGNSTGITWHGGFRYHPREDRSVVLNYGRAEGQTGLSGNANYALTPFTTLSASYSQAVQTQQQQILANLQTATETAPGNTVDQTTGLPLPISNPNLSLQNQISRTKTLQAGIQMQDGLRNKYALSLNRTEEEVLTLGTISQTTNGSLFSWSHDLSPDTTGIATAGYSTTQSKGGGVGLPPTTSEAATLALQLTYALSDTLTSSAAYTFVRQTTFGGAVLTNLLTVGLRKNF